MTEYVYTSTTGKTLNIDSYIVTVSPGLQSKYQIDALDALIGISVARTDDGVLVASDTIVPARGTKNAEGNVVNISFNEVPRSVCRVLCNYTGSTILTGGTANTKTLLKQVALPNGWAMDYRSGIRASAIFGCSLNTNSKSYGVSMGTSFGTSVDLWSRTRASASVGADSLHLDIQRSPVSKDKLMMGYGGSITVEGVSNINTSSYIQTLSTSVGPEAVGTSLYFWGNLVTSNADEITLARVKVDLVTAEY